MQARPGRILIEIVVLGLGLWLFGLAARADAAWFARHMIVFSFRPYPAALVFVRFGRVVLCLLGLLLILVVRPALGRIAERQRLFELIGGVLRIALAIFFALGVAEWWLRARERRIAPHPELSPDPSVRFGEGHPRYAWWFAASRSGNLRIGGRNITFTTNVEHNRAARADETIDWKKPTIVFVGESITAGHGVEYDETFAAQVGERLGLQVVNLGVHGYGSDQSYERLIDTLAKLERPVAVVTLFIPGLMGRNHAPWRLHLELDEKGAFVERVPHPGLFANLRLRRLVEDMPYWSDAAIARSVTLEKALYRETMRLTEARRALPLFVVVEHQAPQPFDERADAWLLRSLFIDEKLPFVLLDYESEIPDDGHPNAHAHAQIADAVVGYLKQRLER